MAEDPIVLLADDDQEAIHRLSGMLSDRFYLLMARNGGGVLRFAGKFHPDVYVLADTLRYGRQGTEALLGKLLKRGETKVIVLTENGGEKGRKRWRGLGAKDCLSHPTKYARRALRLNRRILQLFDPGLKDALDPS